MALKAGFALEDITPPPGSLMAAFPRGEEGTLETDRPFVRSGDGRIARRATGARDPLQARALALSNGERTVCVCTCDLTCIRTIDVDRIREVAGQKQPEFGGPAFAVAASHTHSSAETSYLFGNTPEDPWVQEMDRRIAQAATRAVSIMRPVSLRAGSQTVALNHNRRVAGDDGRSRMVMEHEEGVTTGPVDDQLNVLVLEGEGGEPLVVLFNFTAHPLTAGPNNRMYTADYPGEARRTVEADLPGCRALFLNGAAGNIHPRECMREDFEATERIGSRLGRAVVEAAGEAEPVNGCPIGLSHDRLSFSNRADAGQEVEVELSCFSLGEILCAFAPGEFFVEHALRFKESVPDHRALFAAYSNGWPGYVPTRSAYEEGGYGVDARDSDPSEYSRTCLPPGAGEEMTDRLIELARQSLSG
jgi:hypothetical protein